jgi:hypothetical protein
MSARILRLLHSRARKLMPFAITVIAGSAAATALAMGTASPSNTDPPAVAGSAVVGEELTASDGNWQGEPTSFAYQWRRCDASGGACADVVNATAKSYGVRTADVGHRLRVAVTAGNTDGKASATSDATATVRSAEPTPAPPTARNKPPSIRFFSLRRVGLKVYARFRVCDDGFKPITIVQRDRKLGVSAYTRRFANQARPCRTTSRNWTPPARFRHGRYTATLRAVDKSGRSSTTVSRSILFA